MKQTKQIGQFLGRCEQVLLVGRESWQIDHAAAMLSLYYALTKAGKDVTAVSPTQVPSTIEFLPNTKAIGKSIAQKNEFVLSISTEKNNVTDMRHRVGDGRVDIIITGENAPFARSDVTFRKTSQTFDAIVTLGVDSLEECGPVWQNNPQLFTEFPVLNLSTSISNEHFGRFNVVDPSKSAVSEIVYEILNSEKSLSTALDKTLATTILTGILSATDSFLSPLTTANSLRAASALQQAGAAQSDIVEHLFKEKTFANLKVLGQMLTNLELASSHRLAWSVMTASQFESLGTKAKDIDHWADQILRHTNGSDFFVLLLETTTGVLVQIRSSLPQADFASIAEAFSAAATVTEKGIDLRIEKNLNQAQIEVLEAMKTYQTQRLRLEKNQPFVLVDIHDLLKENKAQQSANLEKMSATKKSTTPTAPENIPFEAPIRAEKE